jgi:hypothetical protein
MPTLANVMEDSEFPQLREINQPEKLAQMLRRYLEPALAANDVRVQSCAIDQLRYKPGGDCRILLTANIGRRNDETTAQQIFFGKLFRSQRGKELFDSCDQSKLATPRFGPAMLYIAEWEMVLWAYPNDPNLPGLSAMVDAEKILALAQAAPEKFGLKHPPVAARAELKKYVPGMRCGYIYSMRSGAANNPPCAVYGKAYRGNEGQKAFTLMKQIWETAASQRGDFVLPQPYSYDPERQILWQEALPGQPFAKLAENLPNLPETASEIGSRLAAFHGTQLQLPLEMTFEFQLEEVRRAVAAIKRTFPDHARACAAVGEKLLTAAARLGSGPVTPVHASFKFSHIFATAQGMAFIDFDGANLGDPGYDLGRFLAHLYKMQAGAKIDAELAAQTAANFCASYNRAAAAPLPQARLNWFAAAHVIGSQVYKSVKRLDADLVSKLLNIADQLVAAK